MKEGLIPKILIGGFLLLLLAGCSSKKDLSHAESCDQRFGELEKKYEKKKYSSIRESLNDFLSTCSGTPHVEKAQFYLANSHFHLKEWIEAEAEFIHFTENFPQSPLAEQARYSLAVSSQEQIYSMERDQANTYRAMDKWNNYLREHPDSQRADSARMALDELKTQLANKELRIARLYLKRDEALAAAIYYKSALEQYPGQVDSAAVQLKLTECYLMLNQLGEAGSHLETLDGMKPSHPLYDRKQELESKLREKNASFLPKKKTDSAS